MYHAAPQDYTVCTPCSLKVKANGRVKVFRQNDQVLFMNSSWAVLIALTGGQGRRSRLSG